MKHAVVVGSSDGIGLAVARALTEEGWRVTGMSRREGPYTHVVVDVTSPAYREKLRGVGDADICVYCAGIGDRLDLNDLESDRRTFEVNLLGALTTIEVLLPRMRARKNGHFVVLSSQADALVSEHSPAYNASKAGLSSYVEGLGLALRGTGVRMTNVRFGFVDTKMAKSPSRPFVITAAAARVVMRALERPRVRVTHPLAMAAVVWLLACATWLRIFWS